MCWYNKHNVAAREADQKASKNESEKNEEKFQSESINNNTDRVLDIEKNNTIDNPIMYVMKRKIFCWVVQIV